MSDATETVIEEDLPDEGETPEASGADAETDATSEGAEAGAEGEATAEGAEAEESELVVTIGEETQAEADEDAAKPWVKELRQRQREMARALRQKDARIAELEAKTKPPTPVLGAKPTLESCDFDAEKFEAELEAWHTKKRAADDAERQQQQQAEQARARWQSRLDDVSKAAQSLKVRDADEAAEAFEATFSVVQQGVIMDGPTDPKDAALLRYALGKNPGVAKKLAAIDNPVRFAFEVARILNKDLSVKPRTAPPPPDRVVRAGVAGAAAGDVRLEELRRKAEKSGDYSAYFAAKRDAKKAA